MGYLMNFPGFPYTADREKLNKWRSLCDNSSNLFEKAKIAYSKKLSSRLGARWRPAIANLEYLKIFGF